MITIDKIIFIIKEAFKNGCPNGVLLGWDLARFYNDLVLLCKGREVINNTDFNYSYCNSYDIYVRKQSEGSNYILTLKISFIADIYSLYVTKYSANFKHGKVIDVYKSEETHKLVEMVRLFIEDKGFIELKDEWMSIVIDGVELELSEKAEIGKCLFDDFEG